MTGSATPHAANYQVGNCLVRVLHATAEVADAADELDV